MMIETRLHGNNERIVPLVASNAITVVPSDTDYLNVCNLFVGTGGDIKVLMADNLETPVIFKNITDGSFLPIFVIRVYDTDTDADDILALY